MSFIKKSSARCGVNLLVICITAALLLTACSSVPSSRAAVQVNQFQNLFPAAVKGNLEAEDDIGYLYQTGEGTPADERQAVIWYRRAAEDGYAPAERHLGYMYGAGLGLPRDYVQALIWYRRAAQQGDAWAENNIGSLYAAGEGVPQDYQLARLWFTRAASQRNPAAQVNLGDMYSYGLGTPRDYATAREWYTLAAVRGDFTAQLRLAWLYVNGHGVAPDQGQAQYWFEKAANHEFVGVADFRSAVSAIIAAHALAAGPAPMPLPAGTAVVSFTYSNGKATQARIVESSGNTAVDAAVLRVVNSAELPPPPGEPMDNPDFKLAIKAAPGGDP
jgi:TonB family protein